jgi:hypothetical protein
LAVRLGTGFWEGAQRLNAGWSSPVARQAHNLKVIGSNPIPATKFDTKTQQSQWIAGFLFLAPGIGPGKNQWLWFGSLFGWSKPGT